jgi:hypothetical protein
MKPEPHLTPKISGPTHLYILTNPKLHNLRTYLYIYVAALWWKLNCFTEVKNCQVRELFFRNALSLYISNHKSWTVSQNKSYFLYLHTLHFQKPVSDHYLSLLLQKNEGLSGEKNLKYFFHNLFWKYWQNPVAPLTESNFVKKLKKFLKSKRMSKGFFSMCRFVSSMLSLGKSQSVLPLAFRGANPTTTAFTTTTLAW